MLRKLKVRGPFLITQSLRPYIPNHDNARIIVISSVSARLNGPGQAIYSGNNFSLHILRGVYLIIICSVKSSSGELGANMEQRICR